MASQQAMLETRAVLLLIFRQPRRPLSLLLRLLSPLAILARFTSLWMSLLASSIRKMPKSMILTSRTQIVTY